MNNDELILDDFSDVTETPKNISKGIDLDDLSDTPEADKYFKIMPTMNIPKGTVFTISEVKINRPATVDKDGKDLVETNAKGNKYYKGRLEIRFAEQIDGMKIRDFVSGLYWSVKKETGELLPLPTIPKAAEDLNDKFAPDIAKLRKMYCNFKKIEPKDLSDKAFLKGLIGSKITTEKETGKNPKEGREYIKLKILGFTA